MDWHRRIRDLREDNDLSQATIAQYLNISQKAYSDYEIGKTRIPVDSLIRLAQYYNVSMDYICGVTDTIKRFPGK